MNRPTFPHSFVQAPSNDGITEGYMPGFGNDFETEALPGALPQGQNSPQKCNYGLYANNFLEQRSQHPAIKMNAHGVIAFVPL